MVLLNLSKNERSYCCSHIYNCVFSRQRFNRPLCVEKSIERNATKSQSKMGDPGNSFCSRFIFSLDIGRNWIHVFLLMVRSFVSLVNETRLLLSWFFRNVGFVQQKKTNPKVYCRIGSLFNVGCSLLSTVKENTIIVYVILWRINQNIKSLS